MSYSHFPMREAAIHPGTSIHAGSSEIALLGRLLATWNCCGTSVLGKRKRKVTNGRSFVRNF